MIGTTIIYSPEYQSHKTERGHPESPRRLQAILSGIESSGLLEKNMCRIVSPRIASMKELKLVHTLKYIRSIRSLSEIGGGTLDEETATTLSPKTFRVAKLAAGGVLRAVEGIMTRDFQNAFVLCRPPGHHALPDRGLGFCVFNNVALAARKLIANWDLDRILILDIDSHHGNGTQRIFYQTNRVLFLSLHEDPTEFPETGFIEETGTGKGLGYNVNVPLPFGTGDAAYWKAIKTIIMPIAQEYNPQFILISAGFDGYYKDPVGELSLSMSIFPLIFRSVLGLAHNCCQNKIMAVLEGGYHPNALRRIVPQVIGQMAGELPHICETKPILDKKVQKKAIKIIEYIKKTQLRFWKL